MTKKSLLLVFICLLSLQSIAQSTVPKVFQRMYIGFSVIKNSAKFDGSVRQYNLSPDVNGDTISWFTDHKTSENIGSKLGYGMVFGTYFPLTNFGGSSSALTLNVEFAYNYFMWKQMNNSLYKQFGFDFFKASGVTVQYGLPIGLDVKFGSEATTSRNQKMTAGFGAGVAPYASLTSFEDNASTSFAANPYIRVDGGMRIGIVTKLRLQYTIGGPKYINDEGSLFKNFPGAANTKSTLTGRGSFMATLILYPMSWKWEEYGWWQ